MQSRTAQPSAPWDRDRKETTLAPGFQALHDCYEFDYDQLDILFTLHAITKEINTVNPPMSETIPMRLRGRMRSVQYNLLREGLYDMGGSGHQLFKVCRLGAMLYVGTIQNEFWGSPVSENLISHLKSCFQSECFDTNSLRALRFWLLFLVSPLVLDATQRLWFLDSIVEVVRQLSLSSWSDAVSLLETFAWTRKVLGKSGQQLWDETWRMRSVVQE
jgi:hypothetical protein